MRKSFTVLTAVAAVGLLGAGVAAAGGPFSFGLFRDQQLANQSKDLFGVGQPLAASSTAQITQADAPGRPDEARDAGQGAAGARRHHPGTRRRRPDLAVAEQQAPDVPDRLQRGGHDRARAWSGSSSPPAR